MKESSGFNFDLVINVCFCQLSSCGVELLLNKECNTISDEDGDQKRTSIFLI